MEYTHRTSEYSETYCNVWTSIRMSEENEQVREATAATEPKKKTTITNTHTHVRYTIYTRSSDDYEDRTIAAEWRQHMIEGEHTNEVEATQRATPKSVEAVRNSNNMKTIDCSKYNTKRWKTDSAASTLNEKISLNFISLKWIWISENGLFFRLN